MRRMTTIFSVLFLLVSVWLIASESASASSLSSARQLPKQKFIVSTSCHHLQVHLQGKQTPTTKCLDSLVRTNAIPAIAVSGCGTDSVVLYWDGNLSGDTVCFNGSGSTDLTSYCGPWDQGGCLTTWNDQASSFHAYNITGALYADIGDNGRRETFAAGESNNLYGNSFSLGNDNASSLATQSCTYNDNLGEVATYFIGRCCLGSIRSKFPGEYLNSTLGQILSDKNKGVKRAADAYKLLNDGRFRKS
jgi:hypothetical protein